jgi:hypothetical protein
MTSALFLPPSFREPYTPEAQLPGIPLLGIPLNREASTLLLTALLFVDINNYKSNLVGVVEKKRR